jgi:hypothetical protein
VWISEQTAAFALYIINWLVFITVVESVYSAVRTDCLYKADLQPWWKVFTARCGLIAYIKQIYNRAVKCLLPCTDKILKLNKFLKYL